MTQPNPESPVFRPPIHVRWMIRRDMAVVLDIEQASFPNPWTEADFVRVLRNTNTIGMVAEHAGVYGYLVYEIHGHWYHLVNFAVAQQRRRVGIGRAMIQHLIDKLGVKRFHMTTDVRETNVGAQLFLQSLGFGAVATWRDHYEDSDELCIAMQFPFSQNVNFQVAGRAK